MIKNILIAIFTGLFLTAVLVGGIGLLWFGGSVVVFDVAKALGVSQSVVVIALAVIAGIISFLAFIEIKGK